MFKSLTCMRTKYSTKLIAVIIAGYFPFSVENLKRKPKKIENDTMVCYERITS
jgi:hypothetical protein